MKPETQPPAVEEHGTAAAHVLRQARALIAEKGWTQGLNARDADGFPVAPTSPKAACFCLNGALIAANPSWDDSATEAWQALDRAAGGWPVGFNDTRGRTREEILALFDKAIALAETERQS